MSDNQKPQKDCAYLRRYLIAVIIEYKDYKSKATVKHDIDYYEKRISAFETELKYLQNA